MTKKKGSRRDLWLKIRISRTSLWFISVLLCLIIAIGLLIYFDKIAMILEWKITKLENRVADLLQKAELAGAEPTEIDNFRSLFNGLQMKKSQGIALLSYKKDLERFIADLNSYIDALAIFQKGYLARIVQAIKDVTVNTPEQVAWSEARVGFQLKSGDKVKTGQESRADIATDSGNTLRMNPSSMIIIKDLSRDKNTFRPREEYSIKEAEETDLYIRTMNSDVILHDENAQINVHQKSEVSISKKQRNATISVFNGLVEVKNKQGEVKEIATREAILISYQGTFEEKLQIPYPPELLEPPNLKFFRFEQGTEIAIQLRWAKRESISLYHLQVSTDIDFNELLLDLEINGLAYTMTGLGKGNYFWRMASIGASSGDIRSEFSSKRSFLVSFLDETSSRDITPPAFQSLQIKRVSPATILVEGMTEPGARLIIEDYDVSIKEDGSFSDIISLQTSGKSRVDVQLYDRAGNVYRRRVTLH